MISFFDVLRLLIYVLLLVLLRLSVQIQINVITFRREKEQTSSSMSATVAKISCPVLAGTNYSLERWADTPPYVFPDDHVHRTKVFIGDKSGVFSDAHVRRAASMSEVFKKKKVISL